MLQNILERFVNKKISKSFLEPGPLWLSDLEQRTIYGIAMNRFKLKLSFFKSLCIQIWIRGSIRRVFQKEAKGNDEDTYFPPEESEPPHYLRA